MDDSERVAPRAKLRGYRDHVRMLWSVAPGWSTLCLITVIISAGCNALNIISIGQLVSALAGVLGGDVAPEQLWRWFAVFAGAAVLSQIANATTAWGSTRVHAAYLVRITELLAETGMHPRNLGTLESETFSERLGTLTYNSRGWLLRSGLTGTWEFLHFKLTAVASAVIVFSWRWWVPLVVIAFYLLVGRTIRYWLDYLLENIFEKPSDERRRADYASQLMIHPEAAKEVRLFGIGRWLEQRYSLLWKAFQLPVWQESRRRIIRLVLILLSQALVIAAVLALLAADAISGRVAVAGVTSYVIAILGLEAFGPMGDIESGLIRASVFLRNLFTLRRSVGLPELRTATDPADRRTGGGAAPIDIDDLRFGYPTRDEPTLDGLSLHIPAGQSIAVVGVNGAGKSTLIKLIAGLYSPDAGTVRVGGREPSTDREAADRVAVVFQDFVHYPLPLRDNVGFGALGHTDQSLLDKAIADAAGTDVLQRLDHGWDTILSKEIENGTDLSGGQWQRVALARALAAVGGGAGVLVLDEPTAALDVRAEAEIFDRFLDFTSQVTTILVSHRLSTVRRADRIVVLDGHTGRISEDGSHQELMAAGGAYARMFTVQAERFARAGGEDV